MLYLKRTHNTMFLFTINYSWIYTVTPLKFAAVKVSDFDIMTYSLPFNFAVFYQNYFTVSYLSNIFDNMIKDYLDPGPKGKYKTFKTTFVFWKK